MDTYQNKNIFPVAHYKYCHNIKQQVYVHIYKYFSVTKQTLS